VVDPGAGYISPVTGVRVCVEGTDLVVTDPDGEHRWLPRLRRCSEPVPSLRGLTSNLRWLND